MQALRERIAELEAAAAEREERMEAVYLQAFESDAALMALSTFEEGRFIEVNDAFLETLGFDKDEVIGKTSEELGLFAEPGHRAAITRAVANTGYVKNVPVTVRTQEGRPAPGALLGRRHLAGGSRMLVHPHGRHHRPQGDGSGAP